MDKSSHSLPTTESLHPDHAFRTGGRRPSSTQSEPYTRSDLGASSYARSDTSKQSKTKSSLDRNECLSSEEHEINSLEDIQCHLFGCTPISDRPALMQDDKFWSRALRIDRKEYPPIPWIEARKQPEEKRKEDGERKKFIRYIAALGLQAERRRIRVIREDKTNGPRELVENVRQSLLGWRGSDEYKRGLKWIKEWNAEHPRNQVNAEDRSDPKKQTGNTEGKPNVPKTPVENDDDTRKVLKDIEKGDQNYASKSDSNTSEEDTAQQHDEGFAAALMNTINNFLTEQGRGKKSETRDVTDYNLDKDVKVHILQFEPVPVEMERGADDKDLKWLMQPYQEKDDLLHDGVYKGRFPDQVMTVEKFFGQEFRQMVTTETPTDGIYGAKHHIRSTSATRKKSQRFRWFHIPYNNMEWVEKAMSRYFGEGEQHPRVDMVLRDDYWKGQEYGSVPETIVHSRHLRPLCDRFSTDPMKSYTEKSRNNVVLFMPYLHWDTDRNRSRMAEVIQQQLNQHVRHKREADFKRKKTDQSKRRDLTGPCLPRVCHSYPDYYDYDHPYPDGDPIPETVEEILWQKIRKSRDDKEATWEASREHKALLKESQIFQGVKTERGRRLRPAHELARLLVDAARLYEAIATFQDRKVLEGFLFSDLSVHPRRSLDQGYFWKLRTTFRRDRDQVVYRYTKPTFRHTFSPPEKHQHRKLAEINAAGGVKVKARAMVKETKVRGKDFFKSIRTWDWVSDKEADQSHNECPQCKKRWDKMKGWKWDNHTQYEDHRGCDECREQIRKLSRAVMVDQLWMWILDENTILTCFPRRYGVGKKDPSGVHHSIRRRLKEQSNSANNLRSVFDLGLIILEECFDTFFDRTKTTDGRPQIMDMFAESIGKVSNRQTIAFRHLWQLVEMKIHEAATTEDGVTPESILALVGVMKESYMQREIRDIVDELDIIIYVVKQQQQIVAKYIELALEILDPPAHDDDLKRVSPRRKAFQKRAKALECELVFQIEELEGLKRSAESTAKNVDDLITLKQQQASIVQAYQAMKEGEETTRQGKAIMLFTVMTIIFLPLSFMSSVFGMNSVELTGSSGDGGSSNTSSDSSTQSAPPPLKYQLTEFWPVTFVRQLIVMFSVSAMAVLVVLIPAFSPLIRTVIWSPLRLLVASVGVYSQLYRLWLWLWGDRLFPSEQITQRVNATIEGMREDVRRGRRARTERQSGMKDFPEEARHRPEEV